MKYKKADEFRNITERTVIWKRGNRMSKENDANNSPVDEKLPYSQLILFGIQHVLIMCTGSMAVSLILGNSLGLNSEEIVYLINADFLLAGVATVIQGLGLKNFMGAKSPLIEGASMAAVSSMVAIGTTYSGNTSLALGTIFCAVFISGLLGLLMAPFFGKLSRLFPRVVTGTVITSMGLNLMAVAIKWTAGNDPTSPDYKSPKNIFLALFVLVVILILNKILKGVWNNIALLIGLIIGTIAASMLGIVDYSRVVESSWLGFTMPFHFGSFNFDLTAVISMILVMVVMMTQAIGNMISLHEMIDKPLEQKDLVKGLRADCFATMMGGIFNSYPRIAFGQNIGLVNLTGVRSRYTGVSSGIMLVILGFFPKIAALVAAVPYSVLGGAGFVMFGMIIVSGIKTLGTVPMNGTKNGLIAAVSIGISMITLIIPNFYSSFPSWVNIIFQSGMTTGAIAAIILNFVFNELGNKKVRIKGQ